MGSRGAMWRPIATIAAAVGDVELEDQVLRLSRYLGYEKVLLNIFYFLGGGPALKNIESILKFSSILPQVNLEFRSAQIRAAEAATYNHRHVPTYETGTAKFRPRLK